MKDRRKLIARAIRNEGPFASRHKLAERFSFNREIVDRIVDGLIEEGLVREKPRGPAENSPRTIVWNRRSWDFRIGIIAEWSPLADFRFMEFGALSRFFMPGRRFFLALALLAVIGGFLLLTSLPMPGAGF